MRHVIAFDISMGKSYMVIYNAEKQCIFEKKLNIPNLSLKNYKIKSKNLPIKLVSYLKLYLKQQEFILDS